MAKNPVTAFDGNPSPPKAKPVITAGITNLSVTSDAESQERAAEGDMALNIPETSAKNPSPPRLDSSIGNA